MVQSTQVRWFSYITRLHPRFVSHNAKCRTKSGDNPDPNTEMLSEKMVLVLSYYTTKAYIRHTILGTIGKVSSRTHFYYYNSIYTYYFNDAVSSDYGPGGLAQMAERPLRMREASGSMPESSTFLFLFVVEARCSHS